MRNERKRAAALFCAAALCLGLAGCAEPEPEATPSPTPVPAETARPYVEPTGLSLSYSAAGSLHPLKADDQGSRDVDSLVYETLFRPDADFEPQPVLAESAEEGTDKLSWTVTVKSGVFFSDGTTMTAEHVATSLKAARSSTRYRTRLAGVTGVKASGESVVITLSEPNGALPALLDVPVFLERKGEDLPLGTGPYAFSSGEEDGLSLHYNPAWWRGEEPAFENITLVPYDSLENRAALFGSGEVTVVTTDYNSAAAPTWSGIYESYDYPTSVMLYVGFNTAEDKTCSDPLIRRALSMAFDREHIVDTLLAGHGRQAALPAWPGSSIYDEGAAENLLRDDAAACALLEEAGWKKNDSGMFAQKRTLLSVTLVVNRDSAVKQAIAEDLAKSLESLGVTVTVNSLEWEKYTAALAAGSFDLYLGEVRLTADFDCSALVNEGALNYSGYMSEAMANALYRLRTASGTARPYAAKKLWQTYAEELPFAVLCFKQYSLLARWGMAGSYSPTQDHPFNGIENWTTTREPA